MRKFFGWLVGLVTLVVIVVLIAASQKPDTYRVERGIDINAPSSKVAPLVQDFHYFALWSPWQHLDPKMKETYSGAASGVGAVLAWEGNKDAGSGRMEILRAVPLETDVKLDFYKPFESSSSVTYTMTPLASGGTHVVWSMSGAMHLPEKVMCLFKNMDAMIGPDFERGLAKMKQVAEDPTQP
ncbi:MAG: SRPBCC family protein [Acidobacteriaceae bacterium]|nr:SRPBCC family protein [Acidobacteriaceae bacterium]